jgi:putative ABC transport system permease protein
MNRLKNPLPSYFRPGIIKSRKDIKHKPVRYVKELLQNRLEKSHKGQGLFIHQYRGTCPGHRGSHADGLWVFNEMSHNKHHEHYYSIAGVLQHNTVNGNIETYANQSYQLRPNFAAAMEVISSAWSCLMRQAPSCRTRKRHSP